MVFQTLRICSQTHRTGTDVGTPLNILARSRSFGPAPGCKTSHETRADGAKVLFSSQRRTSA